ncbi:MAG: hypothetical protein AAF531_18515, partial [Actinomycetota bacterium]
MSFPPGPYGRLSMRGSGTPRRIGGVRQRLALLLALTAVALSLVGIAPSAAALTVDDQVVTALDRDGRYLELTETGVDAAVDDANQLGIAFVWL